MNKNIILFCLALIGFTFFFSSCKSEKANPDAERQGYFIPDSLLKTLSIATAETRQLENSITLVGMVDFNQDKQVNIFPLVSGNIQDVKVQLGDYVTEGQTLGLVKSSEMAGYSNNLVVAETNLTATKKQLEATKDLFSSGLASQLDVTNAQVNYDQAVAQLEMVKRVLKINGNNTQGEYIIKAPISGFIVQKNVTNSTAIRADNGNNLFTISDLKEVWIQANLYEANIPKVHVGDSVQVTTLSYPNRIFKGKVDKILNVLDPVSKVAKVRIVLPNLDYALKPQMFANAKVDNKDNAKAICIPKSALIFVDSKYYVLLYEGKGKANITPVEKLSDLGDRVYLASGVKAGDKLIASNALQIYDQLNN